MLIDDMKNTLLTVSLLSAAAALSAQSAGSPKMSYDFIRAGYVQGEEIKGIAVSGTALLGEHVLIGGSYQDLTARNLDDVDGEDEADLTDEMAKLLGEAQSFYQREVERYEELED